MKHIAYRIGWSTTDPQAIYSRGWDAAETDIRQVMRRIKSLVSEGFEVTIEKHVASKNMTLEELEQEALEQYPNWSTKFNEH